MLQVPHRGTVKFFKPSRGWGFIIPDDSNQENVFFHRSYFAGVSEKFPGELELESSYFATLSEERVPLAGERVVYNSLRAPKGMMAINWLFETTWVKAEGALAARPGSRRNYSVRVMKAEPLNRSPVSTTFWQGTREELDEKLDDEFPEMYDSLYYLERFGIDGKWDRMTHPSEWHDKYRRRVS